MNSVISQEQLNKILASQSNLTLAQTESVFIKNMPLRPDEKSGFYHSILEALKKSSSPQETAAWLLVEFESILDRKLQDSMDVLRSLESGQTSGETGSESSAETPLSPIFNRIS